VSSSGNGLKRKGSIMAAVASLEPLRQAPRKVNAFANQSHQTIGSNSSRKALRVARRGNLCTTSKQSSMSRSLIWHLRIEKLSARQGVDHGSN
jgi:hypothetical protein